MSLCDPRDAGDSFCVRCGYAPCKCPATPTDARPGETTALWCPNCDARGWVCNRPGDHRGPCRFVMPLSLAAALAQEEGR